MNLFAKMVNSYVGRRAYQNLARIHLGEVIYDRSRSHRFPSSWRALDETQRFLQYGLDGRHLRVVKLWKIRGSKTFGHLSAKHLGFDFVSEQFMVLKKPYQIPSFLMDKKKILTI